MHIPSATLRALNPHARLTQEQAVAIFKVRGSAPSAVSIAACFGINEKTVRDIWTGRTWSRETSHLDPTRTVQLKQIGRPKGCRDSKPRQKRGGSTRAVSQGDTPCQCEASQKAAVHSCCFTPQVPQENDSSFPQIRPNNLEEGPCEAHESSILSGVCSEYWTPTTQVASLDDQLYDWGQEFWASSLNNDPFWNDWQVAND
jgi:hypothetical protein